MPTVIETAPMPESEALSPAQLEALKTAAEVLQGASPAAALEEFEKMLMEGSGEPAEGPEGPPEGLPEGLPEELLEEGPPAEGEPEGNALEEMDIFQNLFKGADEEAPPEELEE